MATDPPRVARGPKPANFEDESIDTLHAAWVTLATELAVALDRIDALEQALARHAGVAPEALETLRTDPAREAERNAARAALAERLLRPFRDQREARLVRAAANEAGAASPGDDKR